MTIEIFLPDDNPRGVRIAKEATNGAIKAVLFPKNQFEYILSRNELKNPGVYFLFGESEDGRPMVYIGETEECDERLKSHHSKKDFWNYAIVIISATKDFTKSHVKYLEHIAIRQAKEINRWQLMNHAITNPPHITESMEADLLACFEKAKILLSILGFPLFEPILQSVAINEKEEIFRVNGRGVVASGKLTDEGFVVFKGSEAKRDTVPSCHKHTIDIRKSLIEKGTLALSQNGYVFTEDYLFSSPSTAAGVIVGRSTNGWSKWRNADGKTLDQIKR